MVDSNDLLELMTQAALVARNEAEIGQAQTRQDVTAILRKRFATQIEAALAQRPAARRGNPADSADADAARSRSVVDELREIVNDVHEEYTPAMDGAPAELRAHMWGLVEKIFEESGTNIEKLFEMFTTIQLLMLLAGREHHARGFASPMERHQDENLLRDSDIERFIEGLPE